MSYTTENLSGGDKIDIIKNLPWSMIGGIASIISVILGIVILSMITSTTNEGLLVVISTVYYPLYYLGYSLIGAGCLGLPISMYSYWNDRSIISF